MPTPPALTYTFDALTHALGSHPLNECVGQRGDDGEWHWLSTVEFAHEVDRLARGLIDLGVAPGEKVAVASYRNRWEWMCVDLACAQAGVVSIPVYPTISADDYRYIFAQAEVKYAFVGREDLYEKVEAAGRDTEGFQTTYVFDEYAGRPHWSEVFASQRELAKAGTLDSKEDKDGLAAKLAERRAAIQPDDLATIIYTSGTTGKPKGVMLSHRNITSAIAAAAERLPISAGDTVLSFLPLCHIFERAASHVFLSTGCRIALTGTDNLGGPDGDLQAIRPHFFTTVPRLLEKVYEKIYAKGEALTGAKRKLFMWALSLTDDYTYQQPLSGPKAFVADRLVFSKWREALGGRMKGIVTGAAPCPHHILRIFSGAGIPVREAYGLTETSPGLTINEPRPEGSLLGTVGPAVLGVELRIEEDAAYGPGEGEILAHGDNVMQGYYKRPDATAEVFTEIDGERWFRTGDIGTFVRGPGGRDYLRITDRKKELLKTSGGKYVAPAPIESALKEEFLVEHVMVVGDARKFVSAVIVPSPEPLEKWCTDNGIAFTTVEEAIREDAVRAEFADIVARANPRFSHVEQVKKFELVPGPWDVTHDDGRDGELTPTMKLKRRVVGERYRDLIEAMYA